MSTTYARLTSRRAWLIPAFSVWGDLATDTIDATATEVDDQATRVVFHQFTLGGQTQDVPFASLTDHRGNPLPAQIDCPVVTPVMKNAVPVAVVGTPGPASFRIAKSAMTADDAIVDLWIIEAGS